MPAACGVLPRVGPPRNRRSQGEYTQNGGLPPLVHCAKARLFASLDESKCGKDIRPGSQPVPWLGSGGKPRHASEKISGNLRSPVSGILQDYLPLVVFLAVA